jgi:tetratricopeptide (TPR) repeat protein
LNEEALTKFTEASDCLRGDNVYSYAGQDLAKVEQRIKDLKLEMRLAEAKQLEQDGKLDEALTAYDDAVRISGYNNSIVESKNRLQAKITDSKTQSLLDEASILLESKDYENAIKRYDQALTLKKVSRGEGQLQGLPRVEPKR